MAEDKFDDFSDVEELDPKEKATGQGLFDNDFLLLLIILFIFFGNTDIFSNHLNFLTGQLKDVKNYLDMADATLQALDQASQLPKQMLK